jgi:hypothetical protein
VTGGDIVLIHTPIGHLKLSTVSAALLPAGGGVPAAITDWMRRHPRVIDTFQERTISQHDAAIRICGKLQQMNLDH